MLHPENESYAPLVIIKMKSWKHKLLDQKMPCLERPLMSDNFFTSSPPELWTHDRCARVTAGFFPDLAENVERCWEGSGVGVVV